MNQQEQIEQQAPGTPDYCLPHLRALFRYAEEHDVERGGYYDARSGCINFWSHPWTWELKPESTCIGTVYVNWVRGHIWKVDPCDGFDQADVLKELAKLHERIWGETS